MKTAIRSITITIALVFSVLSNLPSARAQFDESDFVEGKESLITGCEVIQALKEGLLLHVNTPRGVKPVVILLTGYPGSVIDGDRTKDCIATYSGTFAYATASGTKKTVRTFKFVRIHVEK